jgi:integrase
MKMAGLYKRDNIFAFRYKDAAGIWREKQTGKRDRKEARKFRDDFLTGLAQGTLPAEMAEWRLASAAQWWNDFRKNRIAPSTFNSQRYMMQPFARILGDKRLRDITDQDLDNYQTKRLEEGIGTWSINKEVLLWSMILRKAKVWRRLEDNYRPLKTRTSDIGQALTRDQLRHLAEVARQDPAWEAAFLGSLLASNCGLRGGEIKKLKIGAVDVEKRRLTIRRQDTKSDAGARHVELNHDALLAVVALLARARELGATEPEHYLMPKNLSRIQHGPDRGRRGYDPHQHQLDWDTAWHNLTGKAGLAGLRFHDLRHSFITHMVEKGIPLGVIQSMVGHMSARMLRHYTHVSSGATRQAVERLEPILTGIPLDAVAVAPQIPQTTRVH